MNMANYVVSRLDLIDDLPGLQQAEVIFEDVMKTFVAEENLRLMTNREFSEWQKRHLLYQAVYYNGRNYVAPSLLAGEGEDQREVFEVKKPSINALVIVCQKILRRLPKVAERIREERVKGSTIPAKYFLRSQEAGYTALWFVWQEHRRPVKHFLELHTDGENVTVVYTTAEALRHFMSEEPFSRREIPGAIYAAVKCADGGEK
jgi:hypothetical protein